MYSPQKPYWSAGITIQKQNGNLLENVAVLIKSNWCVFSLYTFDVDIGNTQLTVLRNSSNHVSKSVTVDKMLSISTG